MKTTQGERERLRRHLEMVDSWDWVDEAASRLLDDADRCAELEKRVSDLEDAIDGGKYGQGTS
jgi:hypothetical protein